MSQIVKATIKEIRGVDLILSLDGETREGVIRRKEISWDRVKPIDYSQFIKGRELLVKRISHKSQKNVNLFSLKQILDPWAISEQEQQFYLGQKVRCTVVNVLRGAVFVQLSPGVDAHIEPKHVSYLFPELTTQQLVQIGDEVMGVITDLHWGRRQISVSLTDYLVILNQMSMEERQKLQREIHVNDSTKPKLEESNGIAQRLLKKKHKAQNFSGPNYLIVDDELEPANQLADFLKDNFEIKVWVATNSQEAFQRLKKHSSSIGLVLIDCGLGEEDGFVVGQEIADRYPELFLLLMSNDPEADSELPTYLGDQEAVFCIKNGSLLVEKIQKIQQGYTDYFFSDNKLFKQSNLLRQIGAEDLALEPLKQSLVRILELLQQKIKVSHLFVLEVDRHSRKVKIAASTPTVAEIEDDIGEGQLQTSLDQLYFSPVRNIVLGQDHYYRSNIPYERPPSLKYLFPLIHYNVCYGLPISVPGAMSAYLLFVFDEKRFTLTPNDREIIQIYNLLLQSRLERAANFDYMRRFEQKYSAGELLGSMVHELRNKLGSLDILTKQINRAAHSLTSEGESVEKQQVNIEKLQQKTGQLIQRKDGLNELVKSFSQVARGDLEAVDINRIVYKVVSELKYYAKEKGVTIEIRPTAGLPIGWGNELAIEQILLNLIRNGIQQSSRQLEEYDDLSINKVGTPNLFQENYVFVETYYDKGHIHPIRISVSDTGPGIPKSKQESIFLIDNTTRPEGQGLGLYISRNLAGVQGGKLTLRSTILFVGSCFDLFLRERGNKLEAQEVENQIFAD